MGSNLPHIIGKQFLHLELPTAQNSFEIQERLGKVYWEKMTKVLEELFDKFSTSDELIRIDRLEIDLGEIKLSEIEEVFPQKLFSFLEEALVHQVKMTKKPVDKVSITKNHFDQWIHFLQKGTLPWNADTQDESPRLKAVLDTLGTHSNAIERLSTLLKNNSKVLERLILQHDDHFLKTILELYTGKTQTPLIEAKKEFESLFAKDNLKLFLNKKTLEQSASVSLKSIFWKSIFQEVLIKKIKVEWQSLVQVVAHKNIEKTALIKEKTDFPVLIEALKFKPVSARKNQNQEKTNEIEQQEKQETDNSTNNGEFYIQNAGVVLIHAFLPSLFKKLELVEDNIFKAKIAQQKAVHLIQYLATKETTLPEYNLLIPKLLCGLSFDIPIERDITLSDTEKDEAEKMLTAAIQHWKALGEVSTVSLRDGFLKRAGKLEKRQSGWYLKIEKTPIDILISKLPWSLGMTNLPWMPDVLRVEWIS